MKPISARIRSETWPLRQPFVIARGAITEVEVVVVEISHEGCTGRGEGCPVPYYGESTHGVLAQAGAMCDQISAGAIWDEVHDSVPAGSARNAVDCAVWDLRCKRSQTPAWKLAGLPEPVALDCLFTIGISTPAEMADAARAAAARNPILKVKLGARDDPDRIRAIREAVPDARLIADANEAWSRDELMQNLPLLAQCRYEMLEQPIRAGQDDLLAGIDHLMPICADESCHTSADLARIAGLYDVVNIKLDKTGGFTEAIRMLNAARQAGMGTMVGCMLGSSLAMAPAFLVAQTCRYADLDAPLLIGADRDYAMRYERGKLFPPVTLLWG